MLRYLKETGQSTPEIEMRALQYIREGYQRILTFECRSGGFNWWEGDNPGNPILTAIGIMMFQDTARVYPAVDPAVSKRLLAYLGRSQRADGSWGEERHLHAGNESLGAGSLRSTCYIAWALQEGGFQKVSATLKAMSYIKKRIAADKDLYTMGVCANALAWAKKRPASLRPLLDRISEAATRDGDQVHWKQEGLTLVSSGGKAGDVELTALVALAMGKAGRHLEDLPAIANWLIATKDPQGNWGYNTQATVLALKTFLLASRYASKGTDARVTVRLNGEELGSKHFDEFNKDVVWQVELTDDQLAAKNSLALDFSGKGNLGYQVVSSHFVPWGQREPEAEPLGIDIAYERTRLKVDEMVRARVTIRKNAPEAEGMVLVTLGVPPGFDLVASDLEELRRGGEIRSFEQTGRQVLLYLDGLPPEGDVVLEYRLKARFPIRAGTGESEVRLYYQSHVKARSGPVVLEAVE